MAFKHSHKHWLAYAVEPTQGALIADWDADGQLVDHLEADPGVIAQSLLVDATLNTRAYTKRNMIKGVRNHDALKVKMNWHGSEVVTADTVTVVQTPLMEILAHCFGGQLLTKSTTLTGGTALIPEVAATTSLTAGAFVGFEDLDDPGRVHIRRILVITALALTLDQGLPFTPANGDKAHGCAITYIDEDVLEDSSAGSRTFAWRLEKEAEAVWEAIGTKAGLGLTFARNAPPSVDLSIFAANFRHETLTKTVWTQTAAGKAPLAVARDTKLFIQTYGVNTSTDLHCSALAVETGVMPAPIPTLTEVEARMEGRGGYTIEPTDTTYTVGIIPQENDWETGLQAYTMYKLRYAQVAQAGKAWAVHSSRVEICETPKWQAMVAQGSSVKYVAHEDLENTDSSNAKLWRSKIILVQC